MSAPKRRAVVVGIEQTPVLDARPGDEGRILFGKWYR